MTANVLGSSIFGIAAFAQPAIGRSYLAGHKDLAANLYSDAAQGTPMVVVALIFIVLFVMSFIVFGVAFARSPGLPKAAGIGFALDNLIQSVAGALMIASAVWIVVALRHPDAKIA